MMRAVAEVTRLYKIPRIVSLDSIMSTGLERGLTAATVGIAFRQNSDVTTEAADVVNKDCSLTTVDEFLHIRHRMRRIALQSAAGGMAASVVGMLFAAIGVLPPVAGAIVQKAIGVVALANALRLTVWPRSLTDF